MLDNGTGSPASHLVYGLEVQWDISLSSGDPTLPGVSKVTANYHSVRETTVRGAQIMCW